MQKVTSVEELPIPVVVLMDAIFCCCCFWDSFSYKGFTFFKYFRITSFAVALIRFTDDDAAADDDELFLDGSLRNTEENLDSREKYLLFLREEE